MNDEYERVVYETECSFYSPGKKWNGSYWFVDCVVWVKNTVDPDEDPDEIFDWANDPDDDRAFWNEVSPEELA